MKASNKNNNQTAEILRPFALLEKLCEAFPLKFSYFQWICSIANVNKLNNPFLHAQRNGKVCRASSESAAVFFA